MYYHDRRRIIARHVYSLFHSLRKTAIVLKVSHTTVARWLKSPAMLSRSADNNMKRVQVVTGRIMLCMESSP
jgi:transposase-like protein